MFHHLDIKNCTTLVRDAFPSHRVFNNRRLFFDLCLRRGQALRPHRPAHTACHPNHFPSPGLSRCRHQTPPQLPISLLPSLSLPSRSRSRPVQTTPALLETSQIPITLLPLNPHSTLSSSAHDQRTQVYTSASLTATHIPSPSQAKS